MTKNLDKYIGWRLDYILSGEIILNINYDNLENPTKIYIQTEDSLYMISYTDPRLNIDISELSSLMDEDLKEIIINPGHGYHYLLGGRIYERISKNGEYLLIKDME